MAIEVLSNLVRAGTGAFDTSGGGGGTQQVFVQPTQPADTGQPYIWIQTGLPGGGITIWYNDGIA